jgi:septal ring-binding cell division protein DamX
MMIQLMTAGDAQSSGFWKTRKPSVPRTCTSTAWQNGRQYYGVTYGNYPTLEDTITAMGDLPTSFKSRGPFHRSIGVMRRQNQE